jgi:hypothetical protein
VRTFFDQIFAAHVDDPLTKICILGIIVMARLPGLEGALFG